MRTVAGALILLLNIVWCVTNAAAENYWIKVSPTKLNGFTVEADIETNIPGAIVLSARLVYQDPPKEIGFIGTGFVRFNGVGGKASVTIDAIKKAEPRGFKLPNGKYTLEVFYYYQWPANNKITQKTGISTNVKGIVALILSTDEPPAAAGRTDENGLRWVVENVAAGNYWDPLFWRSKFGDLEEVEYLGPDDPGTRKMYYIKSLHITLLVDETNNTILGYRMGLAHE